MGYCFRRASWAVGRQSSIPGLRRCCRLVAEQTCTGLRGCIGEIPACRLLIRCGAGVAGCALIFTKVKSGLLAADCWLGNAIRWPRVRRDAPRCAADVIARLEKGSGQEQHSVQLTWYVVSILAPSSDFWYYFFFSISQVSPVLAFPGCGPRECLQGGANGWFQWLGWRRPVNARDRALPKPAQADTNSYPLHLCTSIPSHPTLPPSSSLPAMHLSLIHI